MCEPMDDDMAALWSATATAQEDFEHRGGYDLDSRAQTVLTGLGIGPDVFNRPVESFSGGWKMRIALAAHPHPEARRAAPGRADQPPGCGVDHLAGGVARDGFTAMLLMTSHDREFMNGWSPGSSRLPTGPLPPTAATTISTCGSGTSAASSSWRATSGQQEMLAKEEEFIARFAARASHAAQVQSRVKKIDKIERIEIPPEERTVRFEFGAAPERRRCGRDREPGQSLDNPRRR